MSSSMILVDMSDEKQNKTNIFNIKQNPNSILHVEKKKKGQLKGSSQKGILIGNNGQIFSVPGEGLVD